MSVEHTEEEPKEQVSDYMHFLRGTKRTPKPKTIEPKHQRLGKKLKREFIVQVAYNKLERKIIQSKAEDWATSVSAYVRSASLRYRKGAK